MPRVPVYNPEGQQVDEIELKEEVFGAPINEALLHQAMVRDMANARRGTASTKERGEVAGGGRKPWRQKGTGRARAGTTRSPLWRHGGVTFGPKPRDFSQAMPKKMRRAALKSALSARVADGDFIVVDGLSFEAPKTKAMVQVLRNLKVEDSALVVTAGDDTIIHRSARNLAGVVPVKTGELSVYRVLAFDKLVFTRDAVQKLEEVLAG